MSEMGLLGLANAQVPSLRAGNPAADTYLRTNSSSSPRCEYGASTQFACVFPVIRREILRSASRSKKRMVLLAVAPSRYPVSKPRPNEDPVTSATTRPHWATQFRPPANIFPQDTLRSAS